MKTTKNSPVTNLEELLEYEYGKCGTAKREAYEAGFEEFKREALLQHAKELEAALKKSKRKNSN